MVGFRSTKYNLILLQGKLEVIFAAALAGEYKISVQYDGWEVRNSPWVRYINPGPPDPKQAGINSYLYNFRVQYINAINSLKVRL